MKISKLTQSAALAVLVSAGLSSQAFAFTQITSQMDLGARGTNVSNLQEFLAANPSIYPEGLVTGYYGSLTKSAVSLFQGQYGLDQVGRVGPLTMSKINSMIANGGWTTIDVSGPSFHNKLQTQNSNSATFTFVTNESTMAKVVYNTSPLMFNEGDINSNGFGAIGGFSVTSGNNMGTSHFITIPNLQSNTVYYYTVIATDGAGNASAWGSNNTFRTQ